MRQTTLSALTDDFDVFLLDQFGVLLDGTAAYPKAAESLTRLSRMGKRIAIISNSGKRSSPNEARLVSLGFARDSFSGVVSSGEAAHGVLATRIGKGLAPGAPVLILSRDNDLSGIEGLDLIPTEDPAAAELVLIAGSRGDELTIDDYVATLRNPAARGVPALCTNPDMTMLTTHGPTFGAGVIAELYQSLGGKVDWFGKPYPLIYQVAAERLGNPEPGRIICIGDSPAHDIRGAHGAGYAAALVRTGIHADEQVDTLIAEAPTSDRPDFVIPRFEL